MAALIELVQTNFLTRLPYPAHDFSGQTIIVTGANTGLGFEAARHFTRLNAAKVILAVRNLEKGQAAKESIQASTQKLGVVEAWQLDLSSYESVKQFASRACGLQRLDVLLENAGVATQYFRTAEGNELTITTNVISTFLLGLLLLPKLRESATRYNTTPHLTVVSSLGHRLTSFPERKNANILESLNDKGIARMGDRYNVSKLLEVFFCRELAKRAQDSGKPEVVINFVNPGFCHSEIFREMWRVMSVVVWLIARPTEEGSRALVHATHAGTESHGQYLTECHVSPPAPLVLSEDGVETQKRIWNELSQTLDLIQPGIMANV